MTDKTPLNPPLAPAQLLTRPLAVVNVGLAAFADDLREAGVPVVDVQWTPPAGGDAKLADLLSKLGE